MIAIYAVIYMNHHKPSRPQNIIWDTTTVAPTIPISS